MAKRSIALFGATGSIGTAVLDVVRAHPEALHVVALTAHGSTELLAKQAREFRPAYIGIADPAKATELQSVAKEINAILVVGTNDLIALARLSEVDMVVNAIVGAAGLEASLAAVKAGKKLAVANKESLVSGGPLFPALLKKHNAAILPIDSEHSAIWQALACGQPNEVKRLIITASGGPFRTLPKEEFEHITVDRALAHPTWQMGKKITIDSATLVNKGLEVIEAGVLFSLPVEKITVLVHPQSIIHSMVEFVDSSIMAQLSAPDMRLPIQYALFWPERKPSLHGKLDLMTLRSLTFEQPDYERFPGLALAFEVAKASGTAPAVYNAANEVAVAAFLNKAISFTRIADIIRETVESIPVNTHPEFADIIDADRRARGLAQQKTGMQPVC